MVQSPFLSYICTESKESLVSLCLVSWVFIIFYDLVLNEMIKLSWWVNEEFELKSLLFNL